MSTIKSVVEAIYSNRSDVEVTVSEDGVIELMVWDPEGRDELSLGNTFWPRGKGPGLQYDSIEDAINQVDAEIAMAPDIRSWIEL